MIQNPNVVVVVFLLLLMDQLTAYSVDGAYSKSNDCRYGIICECDPVHV